MGGASFSEFLKRSLAVIARDVPRLHLRLAAHLRERPVRVAVELDVVDIISDGERLELRAADGPPPAVRLRTDSAAILRLVDGERSLEDAVIFDEIELFGAPVDLVHFHESLVLYLQAAVRCPALVRLLREFRAATLTATRSGDERHD